MHHSRMTQWETWSHTIYTQGPSLLSISNYFPTGLTHQSETFLWVYFPDDFSEAAWCGFFFSGPQPFTWLETRKASVPAKSKSVDEGCLLLRLSPLVIDVSPVLLPRHCQTGSIVCVCAQVIVVSSDPISPFFIQLLHWLSHSFDDAFSYLFYKMVVGT